MKKLAILSISILICAFAFAQEKAVVRSGDINVLRQHKTAVVEFDFSEAAVGVETLKDYLLSLGPEYLEDWPNVVKEGGNFFIKKFNKKSPALQVKASESAIPADYKMVVKVLRYEPGNRKAKNVPFVVKSGGDALSGYIEIHSKRDNSKVLVFAFEGIRGKSYPADGPRLGYAFNEVVSEIMDLVP